MRVVTRMRIETMVKGRQYRAGVTAAMLIAAAAIGLAGCGDTKSSGMDPIEWYRDLSGNSINDPKDQAANSKNVAQGSKEPYPNLASVPKLPENAITKADREKMAQSLVADRQNAQYTDEQLRAGQNLQAIAPPEPEPAMPEPKLASAPAVAPKVAAAPTPAPVTTPKVAAAPVTPVKQETLPAPTAKTAQTAAPAPAPAQAPKVQQMAAVTPSAAPTPPAKRAAATVSPPAEKKKKDQAKSKDDARKKQQAKRGSEAPPNESSLRPPTIGALPEGEESRAAPPQPANTPNAPKQTARREPSEEVAAAAPSRSDVETSKSSAQEPDHGDQVLARSVPRAHPAGGS